MLSRLRPSRDRDWLATAAANRSETDAQHRTATTGDRESPRGANRPRSPARQHIWVSGRSGLIRHCDVMRSVAHRSGARVATAALRVLRFPHAGCEASLPNKAHLKRLAVLSVVEGLDARGIAPSPRGAGGRRPASGAAVPGPVCVRGVLTNHGRRHHSTIRSRVSGRTVREVLHGNSWLGRGNSSL